MKWIYWNGKMVAREKAVVNCLEPGFLFGQGVFETLRCYDGYVFGAKEHCERLIRSCPVLGISAPPKKLLEDALNKVVRRNYLGDASLRLNVFAGRRGVNIFVFARVLTLPTPQKIRQGFSAVLFCDEKIGISALNHVKSFNHYFYQRLGAIAAARGFDEGFFLNCFGEVVEGSRSNIFVVKKNKVMTPSVSCGCLPGVTRDFVIKALKARGRSVSERRIFPFDLLAADEIFVTNSLWEVMPVTRLNKKPVGDAKIGPVSRQAGLSYQKAVEYRRKKM